VKVAPCRNDPTEDRSRAYRGLVQLEQRKVGTVERERERERQGTDRPYRTQRKEFLS
jgi:hypothetical protein